MGNPYDTVAERTSVLGPTLRFKGELHAEEELLIQGQIEGSITHSQRVTICAEGSVKANIRAQVIAVEGTVEGDLHAEKAVQIKESAHLRGNVHAPSVSIVDGAQFNGNINMDGAKRAAGQTPHGQAPHGQAPHGQTPQGQTGHGHAGHGQAGHGQAAHSQTQPARTARVAAAPAK